MRLFICLILFSIIACTVSDANAKDKRLTVGWIEKVRVFPGNLVMDAKIDTGADNSSINALNQEEFTKNGKKWIRFTVTNKLGKSMTIERPIVRMAKIKRRKSKSRLVRPVVMLELCIGGVNSEVEVNLAGHNQEEFIKNGKKWLRFTVTNKLGKSMTIERPIVRTAKIKRRKSKSRLVRPVVMLGLCIGGVYREAEVNLADRGRFKYQLLIGRSFMRDRLVVDPSTKFTAEPICQEAPNK